MAKKTSVKRVSDKSKGKEIEKKLIKDLRSPKKTSPKKKINKNVSTKTATKTRVKAKVKVKAEKNTKRTKAKVEVEKKTKKTIIPKKTEAKKKIKKITSPGPIKKKTLSKIKDKILPKSVKETGTKKIAEKPLRKVKVKVEAKVKTKIKAKAERNEKPEKKIRKTASKIGKKVPAEKTKKIPSKKPVKKTSEKAKVEDKIAVRKKTKAKPGERVKKVIVQVQEKALPAAVKEIEARRPVKEEAKAKVEVQVKAKEKEKVTPSIEEKIPLIPQEEMPSEYGENDITLMIVDPYKLFAFWEVREDTLKIFKGDLQIRLYDITGVDFSKNDANSYLDLPVTERMGRTYIDAVPEKEFIADIGIVYEGIFITIARSNIVSTPRASVSEGEGLLPPKLYETGIRIGY